MMEFVDGLKYPWGKPKRLWYILWILIPIIGWFAINGYIINMVNSVVKGKKKEYPEFGNFWDNFKLGVVMFVKYLPLIIVLMILSFVLAFIPFIGPLVYWAIYLFIVPYLVINLFVNKTVASSFEIEKAWKAVSNHFKEYVVVVIYALIYTVIYSVLSIVLVGIPCLLGSYIYLAEFYSKHSNV